MDPSLIQQIESGTYRVDADRVAAAMIARIAPHRPSAVLISPQALDRPPICPDQAEACSPLRDA